MNSRPLLILLLFFQVSCDCRVGICDDLLPSTKRLHILLVADTSASDIGESVQKDLNELWRVLSWIRKGREQKINIDVLQAEQVSAENVLSFYSSRKGQLKDASLLFFYSGHGGLDPIDGHFLAFQSGRLNRVSLTTAMENTGASLSVVLTNCCSNIPGIVPPNKDTGRQPAWDAFEQLFFQHRGLVDITAAEDGTFAWGNFFCQSFTDLICDPVEQSDRNGDGFVEWQEFAPRLQDATANAFQGVKQFYIENQVDRNYPDDLRDFSNQRPQINLTGYCRVSQSASYWHSRANLWEQSAVPAMKSIDALLGSDLSNYSFEARMVQVRVYALRVSKYYSNAENCELRAIRDLAVSQSDGVDQSSCNSRLAHYRRHIQGWKSISERK